jgi:endonuclease III
VNTYSLSFISYFNNWDTVVKKKTEGLEKKIRRKLYSQRAKNVSKLFGEISELSKII